jgi:hypothetical protein
VNDDRIWHPPSRDASGHRISTDPAFRPIATRYLPWRWKLAEYPMRWLARSIMKSNDFRTITGEERIPIEGPQNLGGWKDLPSE